jgi:cytochrome c553
MWKRGYRKNSLEIMQMIAEKLADQDISALAAYFQQLSATTQANFLSPRYASADRLERTRADSYT